MTDLQNLCIEVLDEYGIGGGGTGFDVATTNQEHKRILLQVKEANLYIQNLHIDWRFLWVDWSLANGLAADASEITAPVAATFGEVNHWIKDSIWLDRETNNPIQLDFINWKEFRAGFRSTTLVTQAPAFYSIAPNKTIYLDVKADKIYTPSGEFHRTAKTVVADDDDFLIPARFERMIKAKAVIQYAIREDAQEILSGEAAEYDDLLEKMEFAEWPSNESSGYGENEDITTVVE